MLCFILFLSVCVCIHNGDLKLSCGGNCDYLQVHREWGADRDKKLSPCSSLVQHLRVGHSALANKGDACFAAL